MIINIKSNWVTLVADGDKRNVEDFNHFKNQTEHNEELGNFFNACNKNMDEKARSLLSLLNKLLKKSFKRIRLNKKKTNTELTTLLGKKESLKSKLTSYKENDSSITALEDEINEVYDKISELCNNKKLKNSQ